MAYFSGIKIFPQVLSHTFCRNATKFGSVMGLANRHLLSEFGELRPTFSWGGAKILTAGIWHTISQSATKFGNVGVWSIKTYSPSLAYFLGSTNFRERISHTLFVGAQRNLATLGVWPIETYSPNFLNFGWGSVIPCGDMHQSFTDALVKWFFDNLPMYTDSFRLASILCVA